ncbi:glycosyltransferase family 4 protein [Bradyrhizobium sp. USDA 4469]
MVSDVADFSFVTCPDSLRFRSFNISRLIGGLNAVLCARRIGATVLLTHEPTIAFWCAIFSTLLKVPVVIFAHAFNFTRLPGHLKRFAFARAFRRIERFAVFSAMERDLYSRAFQLDRARFDFVHWGVKPPMVANANSPIAAGEYISAIGGNSRDYRTFAEAARRLPDTNFVLVARPQNLLGIELPANVTVYTNIPFGQAMNILAFSRCTVVPLDRTDAPCGHVTIVAAMYLGVPVIASRSVGIEDYVSHGQTGILFEPRSPSSLVDAILLLEHDDAVRTSVARNSTIFVEQNCSEKNIADHFLGWLRSREVSTSE